MGEKFEFKSEGERNSFEFIPTFTFYFMTSRVFVGSPIKKGREELNNVKDPLVLFSEALAAKSSRDFEQSLEESVTVIMATSWLDQQKFSKALWMALLAAPLVVSYYTKNIVGVSLTWQC